MPVISQILHNNIVLLIEPVEEVQTASIGFWFSVGSRYEKQSVRGISHFVEHMLFKGTSSHTAHDIASSFDRIGGYLNAFTEREDVCAHCVVPAIHAEKAISILCDMSENALFSLEDVEKERDVIISEIITSLDDPEEAALDAVISTVWPDNSISGTIAASVDDVKKISRDMLYSWYSDNFVNGELTICIAGNVNADRIIQILKNCKNHATQNPGCFRFKNKIELIKQQNKKKSEQLVMPTWQNGQHFIKADFQQEQFFTLFPVQYPLTEKEYYCNAVANALIGDTMSSRLFQRLRENSGYCYSVYSFFSYYSDVGLWCAYASSSKENSCKVMQELQNELKKLVDYQITQNEINDAKEHLCGEEIISSEDIEYRMKRLSRNYSFNFPYRTTNEIAEIIRSITVEEVAECVKHLIDFSKETIIVYGPTLSKCSKKIISNIIKQ